MRFASSLTVFKITHVAPSVLEALLNARKSLNFDQPTHQVAIVSNYKMVANKTSDENSYVSFLKQCIAQTIRLGLKSYFLIHAGMKDLDFAVRVNNEIEEPIPVLQNDCPLQIKGLTRSI